MRSNIGGHGETQGKSDISGLVTRRDVVRTGGALLGIVGVLGSAACGAGQPAGGSGSDTAKSARAYSGSQTGHDG